MASKYDLIVVGAGALGTFHAYHAAAAGKKVLLLEKDQRPVNATVRNFGMVIASGMAGKWFDYGVYGTALYKSIQQRFDVSVRNNGSVYIASDDDEQQLIHELKAAYDTKGYESQLLSQSQLLAKYPSLKASYCREALYFPQEVSVEPNLFIHRIHQYMLYSFPGLEMRRATVVTECSVSGDNVLVTLAGGERLSAERVVVASGHEFKILFPELFKEQDLSVSKLQMLRTKPLPSLALPGNIGTGLSIRRYEAFTECAGFANMKTPDHLLELESYGIHILLKQAVDGTVIIGDSHEYAKIGEEENLGYELNQHINQLMLKEASRIADFDMTNLSETWAGYYGLHDKEEIFEHTIEDKIFITVGIGGKGMTCSAGYAQENIRKVFNQ
ncbi:TIGR03364 family FAD-dependent oxidoreductase [Dyadobacter pollutisoli]|uniref:TIGR03364 family FAD-dependent oxidoreductase n=1 Tax=Dyadobacter pollutisoli TaxID=2910158 RepID=A0A9E8NF35_9BACT|nr:TIGR03364 family FAD-dependent oxidoreductase [Dyadobacter pollutisoli]WAC14798.1 TIGR03364 family FAD-dependent oxidoreductase [Dyadobacter pollutisoli]